MKPKHYRLLGRSLGSIIVIVTCFVFSAPTTLADQWFQTQGKVHSQARPLNNPLFNSIVSLVFPGEFFNIAPKALTSANGQIKAGQTGTQLAPPPAYQATSYSIDTSKFSYDNFYKRLPQMPTTWSGLLPNISGIYSAPNSLSLNTSWTVTRGQSFVVFVHGTLTLDSNVTVEKGGFLAFIVSDDIKVNRSVTALAGLYYTDGAFYTSY